MGILTREQMEQVIDEGGSVGYNNRIITTKEGLPTAADLAKGDPEKEAAAKSDLEAKVADLQAQIAKLQGGTGEPAASDAAQSPAGETATGAETAATDAANDASDTTDGRGYTKAALLSIAGKRGITVPSGATKADIVALLDSSGGEPTEAEAEVSSK